MYPQKEHLRQKDCRQPNADVVIGDVSTLAEGKQ
jgi:hypothetical protein